MQPAGVQPAHQGPGGRFGVPHALGRGGLSTAWYVDSERRRVLLDVPAILANSDSLSLTELADGVVFVVRSGVTPLSRVKRAMQGLDGAKLRCVVLNGSTSAIPGWLRRLCGL